MEALSPRDANIKTITQPVKLAKAVPAKMALKNPSKGKDHPPPPPGEVCEPPSMDRKTGAIYQTGRCLGKGGFAICYEGQLSGTKQVFALKIVLSHMPQKKMEQKFQTELQIHSKMRHTNIVQFHRAFSFQQSTYIVLELCPNGSLMDMVKKRKFVTESEVRYWTVQMAGAIKYMHGKGIIHRDLKMGNIFLDKDMNIKVGDFGLAAMLLSNKDMTTIRRTTLCGTPNYIAPEILEKGKGGHDHAVDIWSLGIIIFAMLTGKPPFQSDTQDEIYRRARLREYDWPSMDTADNYIGDEAKDLVAGLLQDAASRPNPDQIVTHDFFVSGYFPKPEDMTYKLRVQHPESKNFQSIGRKGGPNSSYAKSHKKACIESDVGPFSSQKSIKTSTYREVAAEEKAGLTPQVPLPDNVVYRPFDEVLQEGLRVLSPGSSANSSENSSLLSQPPTRSTAPVSRLPQQSFAAQQRAQYQPAPTSASARALVDRKDFNEERRGTETNSATVEPVKRKISNSNTIPKRLVKVQKEMPKELPQETRVPENTLQVQARLGADMAQQLNQARAERKAQEEELLPSMDHPLTLFNPREFVEKFPKTSPEHILSNVKIFYAELERALKSKSMANIRPAPEESPVLVIKWVDYTNKFGLGYILSNGSVGCIFNKQAMATSGNKIGYIPPSAIVIPNSERHLLSRDNPNYVDYGQAVPVTNEGRIQFYEMNGEEGISRSTVPCKNYTVEVGSDGKGLMPRGVDDYDERKRQKITLWRKFANYMTSRDRYRDYDQEPVAVETANVDVVTFYQRFGDVGCWMFYDGHYQFNFPDHTKIILSADGTWCDFYHLPQDAANELKETLVLSDAALDDRQKLSYPLQTLLNFTLKPSGARSRAGTQSRSKKPVIDTLSEGIPEANDFRHKVEFIRDIVGEWISNGGVGRSNMTPKGRLRWTGYRNTRVKTPFKHVWATVGARGGDSRKVAWFDPKKPEEIVPDIEN